MRVFALLLATSVVVTLAPSGRLAAQDAAAGSGSAAHVSPEALFSRRAWQRARLLIELRMLELRERRLDCVRAAILRRLPPDLVFAAPFAPGKGGSAAEVKHSGAPRATHRSALEESEDCEWISRAVKRRRPTA